MDGGALANQPDQYLPKEPPDVQEERLRTIVVKSHTATDATQLTLQVDEVVIVLEQDDSGWWGGHKDSEAVTGWFPGSCVRQVPAELMRWPSIDSVPNEVDSFDGADDSFGNQMKSCCAALDGSGQSPVLQPVRVRLVATPQRSSKAGQPRASPRDDLAASNPPTVDDLAASSTAASSGDAAEQAAERAEFQRRLSELTGAVDATRQQAEAEGARAAALEASLQQEQARRRQLEQHLAARSAEAPSPQPCGDAAEQASERAELRRRVSELTGAVYALRQQAESEGARAAALESSQQQEQKSRQQLEQQLEALLQGESAEKTNLRAEAGALRGLLDDERRQRCEEVERLQERYDALLRAKTDELRTSGEGASAPPPLRLHGATCAELVASCQLPGEELQRPPDEPIPERTTRRRLFDDVPDHSRMHRGSQPIAHGAASTPAGGGGAGHPGRPRSGSAPGFGAVRGCRWAGVVKRDEAPPPGCVAERVRALEQQRSAREGRASSCAAEDRRSRRTPPVPRQCHPQGASGADLCEEEGQVFLGMSPIRRGGQATSAASQEPPPSALLPQTDGGSPDVRPAGDSGLGLLPSGRELSSEAASERAHVLQAW